MQERKTIIQIAYIIQQALLELRNERYLESLNRLAGIVGQFRELGVESKKLGMSLTHNWLYAADRCCSRATRVLNDIPYSVSRIKQLIEKPQKEISKLSLLVEELNQLQQEFGEIDFDKAANTISVVTDPINLDDVYLGPFKIQLELNKLCDLYKSCTYHVIALDPNPAATDENVTHPHVNNEQLCEGDGSITIRTSLEQGRLCDFFTMVRSILNTYNPDSPYVALNDWDGTPCYDCGYTMDKENSYYCCYCDRDYCEECSSYCRQCDETVCLGCGGQCPHCEEMVCPNCISRCAECDELCCKNCLEDSLCPYCINESEVNNEDQETNIDTKKDKGNQFETNTPKIKLAR
ncbi:MAG: hypothetical protein ACYSR3_13340 [Planctomycetota bacterium]|jgi:hypothetical protein